MNLLLLSPLLLALGVSAQNPGSVNVLKFDDTNTLFVADSQNSRIFAYPDVGKQSNDVSKSPYNLPSIACVTASLLGTSADKVFFMDLAIHPISKEAYVAVHKIENDKYVPAIVIFTQCGSARLFDLDSNHVSHQFSDTIGEDFKFWGNYDGRRLTFTDLQLYKGKLYIAGLSNGDFRASLRILNYNGNDFSGAGVATAEMFHANHAQNETRAPIRAFTIATLGDGNDYLIGAYTCTPLVLIRLDQIKDGAHIFAKTVAELGYGNTPVDLLSFTGADNQQKPIKVIFLNNKDQSSQVITHSALDDANAKPGILNFGWFQNVGTPAKNVPMAHVMHVDEQDEGRLAGIRRDSETGNVQLLSYMKNLYFRLDDFQSEFEFPDYNYPDNMSKEMAFLKGVQDGLTLDTGIVKDE